MIEGRAEGEFIRAVESIDTSIHSAELRESNTKSAFIRTVFAAEVSERDLLMSFQPLGDNCEFGLVQRPFGAEPIDLLRWNAIGPEALICGLDCNFEDIENPESTELDLDGEEFVLKDHRYGMAMHTFIRLHQCEAR